MREMGFPAGDQRQRLLTSRSGSSSALAAPPAVPGRRHASLEYPAGLAGVIVGIAASGYLSGCVDMAAQCRCLSYRVNAPMHGKFADAG